MRVSFVYLDRSLDRSGLSVRHVTSDPLGLRYLAGSLARGGHEVFVHLQHHRTAEEVAAEVFAFQPDILGISCLTYNVPLSQRFARRVKEGLPAVRVVFGGEHPSLSPETTLTEDVDFVVKGEGELTLLELLKALEQRKDVGEVKGLFRHGTASIEYTGERQLAQVDTLAWPLRDRTLVASSRMNSFFHPIPGEQTGLVTMLASRGCSFACSYCSSHDLWGNRTRFRDATDVADEIDHAIQSFAANVIVFYDLTFNLNPAYAIRLCEQFINRGFHRKVSFYATCRISNPNGTLMLTRDLLVAMKAAGFVKIGVGLESLNEEIAGDYKGGLSPWLNSVNAIRTAHEIGLLVRLFIMVGGPRESRQTYEETLERLDAVPAHDLRLGYVTPLPGTRLDREVPHSSRFSSDLERYDCEQPIIKNRTFSYDELVQMERDILTRFHSSQYRTSVIADIVRREPRLQKAAHWRLSDLRSKGLLGHEKGRTTSSCACGRTPKHTFHC